MDSLSNRRRQIKTRAKVMEKIGNKPLKGQRIPDTMRGDEIVEKFKKKIQTEKYPYITKAEDLWGKLPDDAKSFMKLMFLVKAPVKYAISALGGKNFLIRTLKNPTLRNAARELLTTKSTNPYVIYGLAKKIGEED